MEILTPILIVGIIGLLAGVILAVASIVMAVPKDETAQALEEILPGQTAEPAGSPAVRATPRLWPRARPSRACALPAARRWLRNAPSCWAARRADGVQNRPDTLSRQL